jgi:hypothetical protein
VQPQDPRRVGEGAEHEGDPPVVAQVGDGLGTAAGQIQVGDGLLVQEGEGVGVTLGERLTWPPGPLGAVATKKRCWAAIQPWSRSSSWS